MSTNTQILTTQYLPYVDEQFSTESKKSLVTNNDFNWSGAHTVKVYKSKTSSMNDYTRNGQSTNRFGTPDDQYWSTEEMTLKNDRSFTFIIDKLDSEETGGALAGATALARQVREVVIPEVDTYTFNVMCEKAGTKPTAIALTAENIYDEITKATESLDNAEVPETERVLVVSPETYRIMKKSKDIVMDTDIGSDLRLKGVLSNLDGAITLKIPSIRLPEDFGFMLCHPSATVAPTKLEDYRTHQDPPGISGQLVEGRIVYDAFVLENKANAIYYQRKTTV